MEFTVVTEREALALRVMADRLEYGKHLVKPIQITVAAA